MKRLALVLLLALPALAQEEPLDADPRAYDRVWLQGNDAPIECTILEGGELQGASVKFKKKGETIQVEVPTGQVARVQRRQTPSDAFRERAERIKSGTPDDHRKLGDWAWRTGLETEGLSELRKAVQAAAASASVPYRARLARLLVLRAGHLDADAREDVWEELLRLGKKTDKLNAGSPEVDLGVARALLAQGLAVPATPRLERARDQLARDASGPPVAEDPGAKPVARPDPAPDVTIVPRKDPKKDEKKDDGTRKPGPRRGDKDGEGGARDPKNNPPPAAKPEAAPTEDHSQEKWPGIVSERRLVLRDVLLALAEAYLRTDRPQDAAAALGPLVEAWPQDRSGLSLRAQAKLLAGDAKGAALDLGPAIAANPEEGSLLRDRGIAEYAAGDLDAAKADLEKALTLALEDPRPVHAHLGLIHLRAGRFKDAKTELDAANAPEAYGLAKLGLGVRAELMGHPEEAASLYDEARPLLEQDGLVSYSLALARLKGQRLEDAQAALRTALREGLPFPTGARALAAVARAKGDARAEVRALEELSGGSAASADDLYALGRAYLSADRLDDARLTFDRAIAAVATHVPSLLGAGFVRYAADDREGARDLFSRALSSAPQDPAAPATPEVLYARRALKNLEDARTRRVWIERFDREDGEVKNGWIPVMGYGVDVSLKGKKLVFSGTQRSDQDGGKTRLGRDLSGQTIVKVEARLDLSRAADVRCGLRFETEKGSAILYRDKDSLMIANSLMGTQITEEPQKVLAWPRDERAHTLAIEVEDQAAGLVSFWLDGERSPKLVKIAQMGRALKPVVALFAAAPVGTEVNATVEEVRVYAQRPAAPGKNGGF